MNLYAWLLLVGLSLLWGGSFFFVELALSSLGPLTVVLGRVSIAALALIAYLYTRGLRLPASWRDWRPLFAMAILNNLIPFTLITYGQLRIEGGLASIFNATTPLFTVVFAHFLTRTEKLTGTSSLGIGFGFAGVVTLIGPGALRDFNLESAAQCAILGAAISYALASLYGRRLSHLPNTVAAAGMLAASTILMLPIAVVVEGTVTPEVSAGSLWALVGLALLSTSVAYVIYFRLLATVGATNLMLVTFLIPLSAIALGALFLGERLGLNALVGMMLIFAGLAAVDGRLLRRRSARESHAPCPPVSRSAIIRGMKRRLHPRA